METAGREANRAPGRDPEPSPAVPREALEAYMQAMLGPQRSASSLSHGTPPSTGAGYHEHSGLRSMPMRLKSEDGFAFGQGASRAGSGSSAMSLDGQMLNGGHHQLNTALTLDTTPAKEGYYDSPVSMLNSAMLPTPMPLPELGHSQSAQQEYRHDLLVPEEHNTWDYASSEGGPPSEYEDFEPSANFTHAEYNDASSHVPSHDAFTQHQQQGHAQGDVFLSQMQLKNLSLEAKAKSPSHSAGQFIDSVRTESPSALPSSTLHQGAASKQDNKDYRFPLYQPGRGDTLKPIEDFTFSPSAKEPPRNLSPDDRAWLDSLASRSSSDSHQRLTSSPPSLAVDDSQARDNPSAAAVSRTNANSYSPNGRIISPPLAKLSIPDFTGGAADSIAAHAPAEVPNISFHGATPNTAVPPTALPRHYMPAKSGQQRSTSEKESLFWSLVQQQQDQERQQLQNLLQAQPQSHAPAAQQSFLSGRNPIRQRSKSDVGPISPTATFHPMDAVFPRSNAIDPRQLDRLQPAPWQEQAIDDEIMSESDDAFSAYSQGDVSGDEDMRTRSSAAGPHKTRRRGSHVRERASPFPTTPAIPSLPSPSPYHLTADNLAADYSLRRAHSSNALNRHRASLSDTTGMYWPSHVQPQMPYTAGIPQPGSAWPGPMAHPQYQVADSSELMARYGLLVPPNTINVPALSPFPGSISRSNSVLSSSSSAISSHDDGSYYESGPSRQVHRRTGSNQSSAAGAQPLHWESQTTEATRAAAEARRKPGTQAKFECEFCGQTFTRRYNLAGHLNSHLGARPFECDYPECGKSFARAHDLKRHAGLHAPIEKYPCVCGRKFKRQDALQRHHKSEAGATCAQEMSSQNGDAY
ncbi:uncharacterized protein L969DRAFT_17572 [Mixia osmundae IAM 14324]|uniref:C2H2-type domain-containing protein n=1 Tax=Mixia osmundae (strain CBS 9802 / IAM 14324 / JCM 22182 / KY 12970) TaxID=764103 RepID=G7DVQ4_MIXOS|nr:uncharacterized protein L969DRAFT_17572 [Mixia osmundae IAM 14324]KEI39654.1 hypothetical protein L969DRAFT_17572 [Mixia osmundae IAM 14324]GAA94664.1 hypothetical protein E5Q_01317 [Mixia osmundae IAM 14324]